MKVVKVLFGPYGDGVAWSVSDSGFDYLDGHWRAATDEAQMRSDVTIECARWFSADVEMVFDRVDVPLTAPKLASLEETQGRVEFDGGFVDFGGACPVQGGGEIDGQAIYYRARGGGWSLTVTLCDTEGWTYEEDRYAWPDAGWLHADESEANIRTAVAAFRARFKR